VRLVDDGGAGERDFVPGARDSRRQWVYDLKAWWTGVGKHLDRLVELAGVRPGQVVLDVGCGTGNVALRAARAGAVVTGLDPDRSALVRAARKARRRRLGMTLVRGYADRLPVDDASVDHVVSSLALHHAPADQRAGAAAEILRVLKPGGTVTVLDFAHAAEGGHDHCDRHRHRHGHGHGHGHVEGRGEGRGHRRGEGRGHGEGRGEDQGQGHGHGHRHGPDDSNRHARGHRHRDAHADGGRCARRGQEMARAADAADGGIANLLLAAGLVDVVVLEQRTVQGMRLEYLQGRRPTLAG